MVQDFIKVAAVKWPRAMLAITCLLFAFSGAAWASCPISEPPPRLTRTDVYKGAPFQAGESARYKVSYLGIHAGTGTIEARRPTRIKGVWHRVFYASARTGEWYEKLFVVRDKVIAKSRPWDFGVTSFYLEQNEGRVLSSPYKRKKWLQFDHSACKVKERVLKDDKEKKEEFELTPGANDALGALFHLRTLKFKKGIRKTLPVYTSEKNWVLEVMPLGEEMVEVPAGKFRAHKLKLQTYLGQELQQKGDVYLWIASDHPARPMVQVKGDVKIGSVWIELQSFRQGSAR